MVKTMYKETAKCKKSAIGPAILWIVFMYVFYILWGIGEILLEVTPPVIFKHLILWALTGWFGWTVISKFMIEYEFAARKNEFTATRKLSKKSQTVCSIKYESIEAILTHDEKEMIKNYSISKKQDFVRFYQDGQIVYIIYKFDSKTNLAKLKISRNMLKAIRENYSLKKEEY